MVKQRDTSIDALKGIAIFLVVWGHSIQFFGEGYGMLDTHVGKFIYMFHMPLFFFMSGLFAKSSVEIPFFRLIRKKSVQLILPLFCWSVLSSLQFILAKDVTSPKTMINIEIGQFLFGFWFIPVLFLSFVFLWFVVRIKSEKIYSLLFSCLFLLFIPSIPIVDLYIVKLKAFYPFFILGFLFSINDCGSILQKKWKVWFISAMIGMVTAFFMCDGRNSFVYNQTFNMWSADWLKELYRWVYILFSGIFGIVLCYLIIRFLCHHMSLKFLVEIGQYTLGIYFIQTIAFNLSELCSIYLDSHIYYFIASLIMTSGFYGISKLFSATSLSALLFLGRKKNV